VCVLATRLGRAAFAPAPNAVYALPRLAILRILKALRSIVQLSALPIEYNSCMKRCYCFGDLSDELLFRSSANALRTSRTRSIELTSRLDPAQTLQPTALVHEPYLRLVRNHDPGRMTVLFYSRRPPHRRAAGASGCPRCIDLDPDPRHDRRGRRWRSCSKCRRARFRYVAPTTEARAIRAGL
jgi:hypothetical protein